MSDAPGVTRSWDVWMRGLSDGDDRFSVLVDGGVGGEGVDMDVDGDVDGIMSSGNGNG